MMTFFIYLLRGRVHKILQREQANFFLIGILAMFISNIFCLAEETNIQSFLIYPRCDDSSNVTFQMKYEA